MVRYMRRRAQKEELQNVTARAVQADDPALPEGAVDRVLIVDTWHHIGGREAYADKLAAGLAPEGAVYVVDFTEDSPSGPPAEHRVRPETVKAELEAGGLEARVLQEDLPRQYVVVGEKAR
jgi:cyclopropane fatty-acyl-phospholipid synthase-like methyltransferase